MSATRRDLTNLEIAALIASTQHMLTHHKDELAPGVLAFALSAVEQFTANGNKVEVELADRLTRRMRRYEEARKGGSNG